MDIQYLTGFNLRNLRISDLSCNSIGVQGTFSLSQGNFSGVESLNLNSNQIWDEGLLNILNWFFSKLQYFYLFYNNISDIGIKYLVKAEFTSNLIILSLDENEVIADNGIRIIKEFKAWPKLNTFNLNRKGLKDIALGYLREASMTKLKKLNILGNVFTENGKSSINGLRMSHIHVSFHIQAESDKEKEKRMIKEFWKNEHKKIKEKII